MGGSPFRLIRLSQAGAALLDDWLVGSSTVLSPSATSLLDRLVRAGMVHSIPDPDHALPPVAFVVPVFNDAAGVGELLETLRTEFPSASIVVVDDASDDAAEVAAVAATHKADLVRHQHNEGPAAARNTGWRRIVTSPGERNFSPEVIFFVDADVSPTSGALATVLGHLSDPLVGAAAPRVQAKPGGGRIASYEAMNSPLDLGPAADLVKVGGRTSYVPSAALAIRTSVLVVANGFDEAMRFGEDVDLLWRLDKADTRVRYEPAAVVHHRNRSTVTRLLRQRFGYGSSAAPLAQRHAAAVTPLRMPAVMLAGWIAALVGGRTGVLAAVLAAAGSVLQLKTKLDGKVDDSYRQAVGLVGRSHVGVAGGLVNAANRNYLPLMLLTRRSRRLALVGAVVPPVVAWLKARPRHDPITHVTLKAAEDAAYCAGVWTGAWSERSLAALLPDIHLPRKQNND